MQRKEIGGMACLVLTAMIWGFAFVSQVQGMASMSPLFFGATRFTLGALSLIPLLWFRRRGIAEQERRRRESNECPTVMLGNGITVAMPKCLGNPVVVSVICGIVLFTASTVQQYGILYSGSAGRSGFITALYIVMTPLLAFLI
ncbi:EamA family transporter, partial [Bifidobacterium adolescentis]